MSSLGEVCRNFEYHDSLRNFFMLSLSDTIVIEVVGSIGIICACVNLLFLWKVPSARQPPSDILTVLSIFSFLITISYISTLIYDSINPAGSGVTVPSDFSDFCLGIGSLKVFAMIGTITYNTIFCFYYIFKIKNPLKSWVRENKEIHILCVIMTALLTGLIYLIEEVGISMTGICGLKVSKLTFFIQLGFSALYFLALIISSIIFLKYLRKISKENHKANLFFKYYLIYTIIIAANYLLQSIFISILIADCYFDISVEMYSVISPCINGLVLVVPITITIILTCHPQIRRGIIPNLIKGLKEKKSEGRSSFYDDLLTSVDQNFEIQLSQLNDREGYLSDLKERNRVSLLVTLLSCMFLQKQQTSLSNYRFSKNDEKYQLWEWNMSDKYELDVSEKLAEYYESIFIKKIPVVFVRFISYAPSLFGSLMKMDEIEEVEKSILPKANLDRIYANAQADGGSSGQFFFFTHDNRFILKTLNSKELEVLLQRLDDYHKHFVNNRHSLIVKIYGVFTTMNTETGQALHFMMMGNLLGSIHRKYVLRIYDLKGSSHHRQVFKENELTDDLELQYSKKTMKDLDFQRLEKKIWIDQESSLRVKRILFSDSFFFFEKGLIDYSLIVIKVDFNAYSLDSLPDEEQENMKESKELFYNERIMFKSNKQPGIVYIIGIIDYLQTWNMRKKSEKWYKSLWTRSEGISSQSPEFYSRRFCDNLVNMIFS